MVSLRNNTDGVFRYTTKGFSRMSTIPAYFSIYPLRTKKGASLAQWSIIHDMLLNKEHLTVEGLAKVRMLQKSINLKNSLATTIGSSLKTKI